MDNFSDITLLVPTYNRPGYVQRLIEYYRTTPIKILVADSSLNNYGDKLRGPGVAYHSMPGISLPKKLSLATKLVETKYVIMCADDDFVVPHGIIACRNFLEENPLFVSAQGNSISYKKRVAYKEIEFNRMYVNNSVDIIEDEPFARLARLFRPYRAVFSAVHYSQNLVAAYGSVPPEVQNLFLNEYIGAVVPILFGKHKELPLFYQVREYAVDSGDKTTENLGVIFLEERYKNEMTVYLDYLGCVAAKITGSSDAVCREIIERTLRAFSDSELSRIKNQNLISFEKKMGKLIAQLPFIGKRVVMTRRLRIQRQELKETVKTSADWEQLEIIKKLIMQHARTVA